MPYRMTCRLFYLLYLVLEDNKEDEESTYFTAVYSDSTLLGNKPDLWYYSDDGRSALYEDH